MTQAEALSILTTGASVFLTGEPGSGKTHTVGAYAAWLRSRGIEPAITASTGIAATHLHGMTIHSWSGIGIAERATPALVDQIASKEHVARRVQKAAVLVIDEISMLSAEAFELVDLVCQAIRGSTRAFGGLQVVLVGDFFQLPPVGTRGSRPSFAFESAAWRSLNPIVCYLDEQHRQEDRRFLEVLAAMRRADDDPGIVSTLLSRETDLDGLDDDVPRLYTHNADVDRVNEERLDRLPGAGKVFLMQSRGTGPLVDSLKRGCLSPERLVLKQGAVVMGTKNLPAQGLANGTLGTVVGFDREGNPLVEVRDGRTLTIAPVEWIVEEQGKIRAAINQIPLRLAWAITVHKSQGMSMDAAAIDLSRAFEYGQGYVALSRVRSLEGLHLLGWSEDALRMHPAVLQADAGFRAAAETAAQAFSALDASGERQGLSDAFVRAAGGSLTPVAPGEKTSTSLSTYALSLALMQDGVELTQVAKQRGITLGTVCAHAERLMSEGSLRPTHIRALLPKKLAKDADRIWELVGEESEPSLTVMRERTGGAWSFDELRMVRLLRIR